MPHTLLLADDSVTIRRVIELTFADESVRVVSVSSGREAIATIETAPPDIILADAGMPDISGYDIAAFVKGRADLRHIPVILLAGAFEPLDEGRSRTSGSDGVLVKPFEPQMVVARVRELLSQREGPPALGELPDAPRAIETPPPAAAPPPRPEPKPIEPAPAASAAPPIDPAFDESLDRLDTAFASTGSPLDTSSATEFAEDLRDLRSGTPDPAGFERQDFGDWDLPLRPGADARQPDAAADVFKAPEPEPVVPPLPPPITLAPKAPPVPPASTPPAAGGQPPYPEPGVGATADAPLADAFSSLLAAEEGRPHAPIRGAVAAALPPNARLTDADMDRVVERVIARLGPDVRGAVIDLAERLVKAEIDRLKALR